MYRTNIFGLLLLILFTGLAPVYALGPRTGNAPGNSPNAIRTGDGRSDSNPSGLPSGFENDVRTGIPVFRVLPGEWLYPDYMGGDAPMFPFGLKVNLPEGMRT